MECFLLVVVKHLPFFYSNNLPICLALYGWKSHVNIGLKPSRFEAMWARSSNSEDVIKKSLNFKKGLILYLLYFHPFMIVVVIS